MTTEINSGLPVLYKKYIYVNSVRMYENGFPIDYIVKYIHDVLRVYDEVLSRSEVREFVYKSIYDHVMKQKQQGS